jgi:hypothetical protein
MSARIYQPAKTAMSSGTAKTEKWVLEFIPARPRVKDPLTGWNGADETQTQVRLKFSSLEAAQDYARARGIAVRLDRPNKRQQSIKLYADNFRHDRVGQWTH